MGLIFNPVHSLLVALADSRRTLAALQALPPPAPGPLRELLRLADRHGVLAIVMENMNRLATGEGGAWDACVRNSAAWDWACERRRHRTVLSLLLRAQALELTACFDRLSIPAVTIKGCDFADRLYAHPSLRPFTDIDLLVPESAVGQARSALTELRYQPAALRMKYSAGYGEESWIRPARSGGTVEVHWNLVNSPSLRRVLSVRYEDLHLEMHRDGPRPSASSVLLIAAVHGVASHGLDRLQLLGDVTQAARAAAGPLDEPWLVETMSRTGIGRAMASALALAHKVFREPLCREWMNRLGIARKAWPGNWLLSRSVVLRAHAARDSFRRQLFREVVKRI